MKSLKNIFIALILIGMIVGCGTGNNSSNVKNENISLKSESAEVEPSNWYIRLVVEDTDRAMRSESAMLGQLEADDAVQNHTLKALSPIDGAYLGVVFDDPDGVASGAYKTNFHVYQEEVEDSWNFTVRTDDPNADIVLTWRGLLVLTPYVDEQGRTRYKEYRSLTNPLNKQMKLVDLTNDQEVAAIVDGKVGTYAFNMDGETQRAFKWVVQSDVVALPAQFHDLSVMQIRENTKSIDVLKQQILQKRIEKFDLSKPPFQK